MDMVAIILFFVTISLFSLTFGYYMSNQENKFIFCGISGIISFIITFILIINFIDF